MDKKISLSVLVPFLNEEDCIFDSVNRLIDTNLFKEIILIDNGSTDQSRIKVNDLVENFKNIKLIEAFEEKGKGYCVQKGINYISSTHVIVHDADLEYFPDDINAMFSYIYEHPNELILGSRTIGDKKRNNKYFHTKLFNQFFSLFFSILNFYKVSDISSCYQINSLKKLRKMKLKENGFALEVEILSKNLKMNYKIIEVPINYEGRTYEEGKKIKIKDAISIFFKIMAYSKLNFLSDRF
tara:strand:+ start:330 stop:1049 length:720 start_codon:yes stop_codon:yes gene_type:complete